LAAALLFLGIDGLNLFFFVFFDMLTFHEYVAAMNAS
jgi:hypothetical protein